MSTAEILAELPALTADERALLFIRLCELQEADLIQGFGPTEEEKKLLDAEWEQFQRDGDHGRPWQEVFSELRAKLK